MSWYDEALSLATAVAGPDVDGDVGFGPYTLRVPASYWRETATALRDRMGCSYFDWLSAVDELADGFRVACHVARLGAGPSSPNAVDHLVLTTMLPRERPRLASLVPVYAGAGWHERETHEMFGIEFDGGVPLEPLLLPDAFEGHPLRKEFVLASRVAKAWPGTKEPGESDADIRGHGTPGRRRQRPPGVPDPETWGPREPGSPAPDPLAHAQPAPAGRRPRRARKQADAAPEESAPEAA
ncbi:MAG: NADH-quinone oxidoreductase subunit C, partial [Nocardioidaceae bacterium]